MYKESWLLVVKFISEQKMSTIKYDVLPSQIFANSSSPPVQSSTSSHLNTLGKHSLSLHLKPLSHVVASFIAYEI